MYNSNIAAPKLNPKIETDVVYVCQTNAPDLTLTTNLVPFFLVTTLSNNCIIIKLLLYHRH